MVPSTPNIRQYLKTAYGEELDTLCSDYFRDVYENFTTGMTQQQKIQLLLDYCQRRDELASLLAALERDRPEQYRRRFASTAMETRPESPLYERDPRQVFISHAHDDADFAHRLAGDLRRNGWHVWIVPDSIRPGEKWAEAINRGLEESGVFVVALTPAAVASNWVRTETNIAIELAHRGETRFIPLRVADCRLPVLWKAFQWIQFASRYADGLAALLLVLNEGAARSAETIRVQPDPWSTALDDYKPGELVEAVVTRVSDFGAFTRLRTGADGFIHILELAGFPVAHPSDVVEVGQQLEVKVLSIDKQSALIDLSLKRLQPDPWSTALDDYEPGELVEAVVTRVGDFGASTRLRTGVEGLLHVSEMADSRPDHPQSLVSPGDLLLLRVLRVEPERRRIGLSLRQVSETEWAEWAASYREKHAAQIAEEATTAETADGFVVEDDIMTVAAVLTLTSPIHLELVRIPAGEFLMGSDPAVDKDAAGNEKPQHRVTLPDFYIGKVPVTNVQFELFAKAKGHKTAAEEAGFGWAWTGSKWEQVKGADWRHPRGPKTGISVKADHPVVQISWHDAVAFCRWLSEATGQEFRLPTEAEWEKAARGTTGRLYPWGDEPPDQNRCNFNNNVGDTTPAGQYPGGAMPDTGVLDLAGNVREWTSSLWGKSMEKPDFGYPCNPKDGRENQDAPSDVLRVLRGGSWYSASQYVRCAYRGRYVPGRRYDAYGFRVARSSLT